MIYRMTWAHCGLEYHVQISPDDQDSGAFELRICDEAFVQAPFRLRLPNLQEAMENAVLYVFAGATAQEQQEFLATLVDVDQVPLGMVA